MAVAEMFEKYEDEYLKFERIEEKFSNRPDIHAFILLDRLFPGDVDMVAGAEHDEIFLAIEPDQLEGIATESQIRDLVRCGVRIGDYDCLAMFV